MARRPRDHWYPGAVAAANTAGRRLWSRPELQHFHDALVAAGAIPRATSLHALVDVLTERGALREVVLTPVTPGRASADGDGGRLRRTMRRLVWGDVSVFEVALSMRPRSYLSHGSAALGNGIADATSDRVYVNQEQTPKPPPSGALEQGAIDRAFRNRGRTSNYVFQYAPPSGTGAIGTEATETEATRTGATGRTREVVLLSGKNTGDFGVAELSFGDGPLLRSTGLARTLIDIAVRPGYAGGPATVLDAYRRALNRMPPELLVAELITTLDALAHVYPYHQSVGFYLTRAGSPAEATASLRDRGIRFDFYLDYAMVDAAYDPAWRIHHPSDLR